jgi:hypothetical protein
LFGARGGVFETCGDVTVEAEEHENTCKNAHKVEGEEVV